MVPVVVDGVTIAGKNGAAEGAPSVRQPNVRNFSPTLLVLCLAFVCIRLPFIFSVPMQEAPDEFAHYWVIRFMHDHLRLPNAAEVAAGGPSAVYGSLPQLGYIPHVVISMAAPLDALSLFERFGSLFAGLVLLYATYNIGREIFRKNRLLAMALPVTVLFHPQLAFVHSYANNDATSSALSAVILLLTVRMIRSGVKVAPCALLGTLVGWLALSKYSGLAVMPVVALSLVASAVLNQTPVTQAIGAFTTAGALAAAVSGWWFVRNYHEYAGDILGTKTMYTSWATTFHRDLNYHVSASRIIKDIRWWRMMFFSFWGMFGYMNKYMWRPVYLTYLGFLIASAGAGIAWLVRNAKQGLSGVRSWWQQSDLQRKQNALIWTTFAGTLLVNLAAMIWASTTNLGGPQGRYLFTSEVPALALLLVGLHACGKVWGKRLVIGFVAFNALTCLGVWLWLFSMYGFHRHPL